MNSAEVTELEGNIPAENEPDEAPHPLALERWQEDHLAAQKADYEETLASLGGCRLSGAPSRL